MNLPQRKSSLVRADAGFRCDLVSVISPITVRSVFVFARRGCLGVTEIL
jgi:hypothetical protein